MIGALIFAVCILAGSPALAALKPLDAFLVAGQSNASGRGSSALSPKVSPTVGLVFYRGSLTVARDPVGSARTGSAWPAFANAYHRVTGRPVLFIPAAAGSSSLTDMVRPEISWHPTGHLYAASTRAVTEAVIGMRDSGYAMRLRGILWAQGEKDAQFIEQGLLSADEYKTLNVNLIARYRSRYGPALPFYIIRAGRWLNMEHEAGMQVVRDVQEQIAAADPHTWIVYRQALYFPYRDWMADDVHWGQAGLNDIGTEAGVYIGWLATP